MAKPIINYRAVAQVNSVLNKTIFRPTVVDRGEPVSLSTVITRAIDRGYLPGLKPESAQGVAAGICEQMATEFREGKSVKFGNYFRGLIYLSGTCDSDGKLGPNNDVRVHLIKGAGFRLDASDYTFQNVESENVPKLEFVISDCAGALRNKPVVAQLLYVNGERLTGDGTTTSVQLWATDETGAITGDEPAWDIDSFSITGPNLLAFTFPNNTNPGRYVFKVLRTSASGAVTESIQLPVQVLAAE